MFKILIDTCVWLDLAKDHEQQSLLTVLEELIQRNELSLIVPETIIKEFDNNKDRIIKESSQSLSSVFNRVKEVVNRLGDPKKKKAVLEQLSDVDHKIPMLGESAIISVERVDKLLKNSVIIQTSDTIKLRASQRAIEKRAPFHKNKNSFNDAIIIETYAEYVQEKISTGYRFAFITHNKTDFSDPKGSDKLPHPDFAPYFSKIKSLYFIKLAEALQRIRPDLVTDIMIEQELLFEPRTITEILEAENEMLEKVWYNRHQIRLYKITKGQVKIIDREKYSPATAHKTIVKDIWEGAKKSAKKIEKKYGLKNLGPWNDFEWGMINGKLSTLRWVTGDDWDDLDT